MFVWRSMRRNRYHLNSNECVNCPFEPFVNSRVVHSFVRSFVPVENKCVFQVAKKTHCCSIVLNLVTSEENIYYCQSRVTLFASGGTIAKKMSEV